MKASARWKSKGKSLWYVLGGVYRFVFFLFSSFPLPSSMLPILGHPDVHPIVGQTSFPTNTKGIIVFAHPISLAKLQPTHGTPPLCLLLFPLALPDVFHKFP